VFLKEIKDFIYSTDGAIIGPGAENGFNGEYAGYRLVTQANGGFARIRGIELNYQQQFTNLPGFWRGFGVFMNNTWLETIGDYGTIGASRSSGQVPGFIRRSGNVGISYIHYGRTIGSINANPALQQVNYGRKKVDFSLSYAFSPRLTVYADVVNVFGDTFMAGGSPYIYIPARKRGADEYPPEIKFGVSGRF
jgi:outer membrane receptor protein involved in Fe transport